MDVAPCRDLHCQCIFQELHFQKGWARRRSKRITRLSFPQNDSYRCCPVDVRVFCFKRMLPQALPSQTHTQVRRIRESWALSRLINRRSSSKTQLLCKPIYSFSCDPYILPYLSLGPTVSETLVDGTFHHTQSCLVLRQCAFWSILRSNRKLIKTSFSFPAFFFLLLLVAKVAHWVSLDDNTVVDFSSLSPTVSTVFQDPHAGW